MEILQVAENWKFLNSLKKFHMRNTYKTKKKYVYITPSPITPLTVPYYCTVRHTHKS